MCIIYIGSVTYILLKLMRREQVELMKEMEDSINELESKASAQSNRLARYHAKRAASFFFCLLPFFFLKSTSCSVPELLNIALMRRIWRAACRRRRTKEVLLVI